MIGTDWETTTKDLSQQLASIKNRVLATSARFEALRRQAESTKIQSLTYELEARRKFLAQSRGVASLKKDPNNLLSTGLLAAGLSVLTHMFTKDWLNAGVKGVNGALTRQGAIEWVVCLGQNLEVAPWDSVRHGGTWVTWGSLMIALDELAVRAKGESLGNLDNIISKLKKSKKLLFVIQAPTGGITV
ncbi:hypothetical protein ES707_01983 [subsurface metagenome]